MMWQPFDDVKGWRNCWGGFWCFSPPRRYQRTETQAIPGHISELKHGENGSLALDILNQGSILPPVMGAPPSSPVSFGGNIESASSRPSPATFLTLFPENPERPSNQTGLRIDAITTDAAMGQFILDDTLVTPPICSTLTTASATPLSTAPFTPPPELAHLTNPSSPEVPFAQLLAPPLEIKNSLSEQVHEHLRSQSFPPNNLELIYQLYPFSPLGRLVTSRSGASSLETISPLPESENDASIVEAANNSSIFTIENASFKSFGMANYEDNRPSYMEQVVQSPAECLPRVQHESPDSSGSLKQGDLDSTLDAHFGCDICGCSKYLQEIQDKKGCCSRCGEVTAKCKDLFEALDQTKEKLALIERRVDSIDERERKFKQLMQWMQLGAKLQQESIFKLSKELSWQEEAFLDLQDCHLVQSGINISNAGVDDT